MLKVVLESPKRYKAQFIDRTLKEKKSQALNFGSAIHLALLEPKVFMERYAVEPDVRRNTNLYKDWREAILASNPDAVILSQEEMDDLKGMIDSVSAHPDASAMLKKGIPERSIYQEMTVPAEDGRPEGIIKVKARPDYLHENGDVVDVKSCRDAGFRAFRNQLYELQYHLSAKFYQDIVDLEFGRRERNFWWIGIEKTAPWEVAVYRANDMVMDRGEADYRRALWRLHTCTVTGLWPGKQEAAQDIDLPAWSQYAD